MKIARLCVAYNSAVRRIALTVAFATRPSHAKRQHSTEPFSIRAHTHAKVYIFLNFILELITSTNTH